MGHLLDLIWLAVPAYVILQAVAIWRSSGSSRWVAQAVVMASVFILTGIAYAQDSNLWPLWLLVQAIALVYVIVVGFFGWTRHSLPAAR